MKKNDIIQVLDLRELPFEGGFFRRVFESNTPLASDRKIASSIYYLLGRDDLSQWHQLRQDEIWFFHAGQSVVQYLIDAQMRVQKVILGQKVCQGEKIQHLVPAGTWQKTVMLHAQNEDDFSLFSTVVLPEFQDRDFTLANPAQMTVFNLMIETQTT